MPPKPPARQRSSAPEPPKGVFARHIEVLAAIAGAGAPLRFADLAAATGHSKATLHRILAALAEERLVRADPRGGWRLGLRLVEFANHAWAGLDLPSAAEEEMAALRDATGETVRLAVLQGAEMLYLAQVDSREPVSFRLRVGARGPAYCSGTGKAVLAFLPATRLRAVLDGLVLERHTPRTLVDRAALEAHLEAVRARGFALDDGEQAAEVRSLGAPILDRGGEALGAISLTVPAFRLSRQALLALAPQVIAAAQRIATRLPPAMREPG
ncbi:IclR family transcriptional regulator [Falsiroseomonas tokyonensis]|uniref:IclR family transcriptional regulator n=1 Tax=Falsiroseomonas tokyonensis TaxID=430521 RepID=A0ABV7BWR6_9PROT|nr:IclR family transcriptional regulator [Falsiroseomonas tokyonensis]MBU8538849.1 IclR family transcriptional regulator [Falsiroseomonas tokyonensis]